MICWIAVHIVQVALDLFAVARMAENERDVEILLLRQQLRIATRNQHRGPCLHHWQKLTLAVLANRLKQRATNARQKPAGNVMLFKPGTLLKWHRELVRRKWMLKRKGRPGRPCTQTELEELVLRLKRENPAWGYGKLEGELRKLGCDISETTIRNILARHGIPPVPKQARKNSSWYTFLTHYKEQFLVCDFFTVETLELKTLYVLFFIEHAARRVYVAGRTARSTSAWVTNRRGS